MIWYFAVCVIVTYGIYKYTVQRTKVSDRIKDEFKDL